MLGHEVRAQVPVDLILKLDHPATENQEKYVYEALHDLDPALMVRYEATGPEFHIRSTSGIEPAQCVRTAEQVLEDNVVSVYDLTADRIEEAQVPIEGFPRYIITGNKERDDSDYQQRKEQWIVVHKGVYDKFQAAQRAKSE